MQKNTELTPCSPETHRQLREIMQDKSVSPKIVQRAQMILDTLNGYSAESITERLKISPGIYYRWVERFEKEGVAGLWDHPHTGRMPVYDKDFEKRVLALLECPPPEGLACWDGTSLARELDSSDDAIWRVLRKYHITLARKRIWTMELPIQDPKADRHLVGVYLAPPVRLFVLMKGGSADGVGCVVTHSRKAAEVLQTQPADGGVGVREAISALAAMNAPISKSRRNAEVLEFLWDMSRYRDKDASLCVIYTGDLAECGISSWRLGHSWMEFIRLNGLNEAGDQFGSLLRSYPEIQQGALSYPATAPSFRWQRMIRPKNE